MKPKVACRKCGSSNEINRVFCKKCGTKLDLSNLVMAGPRRSPGQVVLGFIRFVVLVVVVGGVSLMLWPVAPTAPRGTAADASLVEQRLQAMARSVEFGRFVVEVFSDAEVNAYLADVLKQDASAQVSDGYRVGVDDIRITFTSTDLVVLVLAKWGPVALSYEFTGVPELGRDGFGVRLIKARLGHLPLGGPAADWMLGRVAGIFQRMDRERTILDNASRLDLIEGRVRVATRGS